MICGARSLVLFFIIIFAAGVMCSVVCPERDILPHNKQQERGPCTDCTSTDFIAGAKISNELIFNHARAGLEMDWFITSPEIGFLSAVVSTDDEFVQASPPLLAVSRILRV
jgi:hypothetical protein